MPVVSGELLILVSFSLVLAAFLLPIPPLLAASLALFSYFLTQLIIYGFKMRSLMRSGIKMERHISGVSGTNVVFTDKRVRISVSVENFTSYNYGYLELEDCLPQNWEVVGENQAVFNLPAKGRVTFNYLALAKSSGSQVLPGLYATVLDESHLFSRSFFYPLRSKFNIFLSPEEISLKSLQISASSSGWTMGPHVMRQKGMGTELREIRDYMPGDSFKKIAWGISARKNKLMSRELESEISIRSILFLDISPSMREGIIHQTKLDYGMKMAANFARLAIEARDPVGIFTFDSQIRSYSAPRGSKRQLYTILNILSQVSDFEISMTDEVFNLYFSLFQQHLEKLSPYLPDGPRDKAKFAKSYLAKYFQLPPSEAKNLSRESYFRSQVSEYLKELDMISQTPTQLFCSNCQSTSPFYTPTCPRCGSEFDELGYDKTEAITKALCRAMAGSKGKEIYVLISDLERILDLKKFLQILGLVLSRSHKMVILSPSTLSFQAGGKYDLKERFTEEFLSKATETERKIKELGIEVHSLGPTDSVNLLLSNIMDLKQRQGVV